MTKNENVPFYNLSQQKNEKGFAMVLFEEKSRQIQLPKFCRERLLGYADSFMELAKSFQGTFAGPVEDRRKVLEERKLWENRQVICTNLNEMSHIMTRMAGEVFRYQPLEEQKAKKLYQGLKAEKIMVSESYYLPGEKGELAVGLTLSTKRKGGILGETVADMVSVLLDIPLRLSINSPGVVDSTQKSFLFVEEAGYVALTGFARVTKEGETVSGDNYSILESERGQLTLLLSDGTGSGEEASRDSEQILDLMEKLLETGYHLEGAINLVNASSFLRGEEIRHPTLDVCDFDLYNGKLQICKVGGADTFIRHGNQVDIISGDNLPLGIFQKIAVESRMLTLGDGDCVIMMTDGVLDAFQQNNYKEILQQQIGAIKEQNPGLIAEKILQMAIYLTQGKISDDMTVLVAGIWENQHP